MRSLALISRENDCRSCYKCIRACPTKSISFKDGQASIIPNECVYCGSCYLCCPQSCKQIRDDRDAFDLVSTAFPAGTLSGAPKIRAMEIIHELEPGPRGFYGGAVGYFSCDGNMDLAITIRTIEVSGRRLKVQAGCGIVADSVPEMEYQETLNKARALFKAVEFAEKGLR